MTGLIGFISDISNAIVLIAVKKESFFKLKCKTKLLLY
jgi:hypothetical protein